jgi:predicted SAM-dependent methyltransferase
MGERLHLGCGRHYWPGFINIDATCGDIQTDIRTLSGYQADEIHAIHVIEHLPRWEVPQILKVWAANLKPGGLLALECPDLDKALTRDRAGLLMALYGDQSYESPLMTHMWCYSAEELRNLCIEAGFESVSILTPFFHKPRRDMRIEAKRADH